MARAPKGTTNRAAFESHARIVASDLRGGGMEVPREPSFLAMSLLFAAWANRYGRRRDAVAGEGHGGPSLADRDLADRLAARWRARDAAASALPRCWDAEARDHLGLSYRHMGGMARRLDVAEPAAPHAFGPSFRALCLEAEARGAASFGDVVDHVLAWAKAPAPLPVSAAALKKVAPLLATPVRWQETGDDAAPWQAEVEGTTWLIRLGDFPHEPAYRIEVDGRPNGVFHDWPDSWLRGPDAAVAPMPVPAPAIALPASPERWPDRYAAGEHEQVWAEMTALGPLVRDRRVLPHAEAVARETMRRVRHDIGLIVPRLAAMGYVFGRPEAKHGERRAMMGGPGGGAMSLGQMFEAVRNVDPAKLPPHLQGALGRMMETIGRMSAGGKSPAARKRKPADPMQDRAMLDPPDAGDAKILARLARRGLPLPLSLRFWIEEVGQLDLAGRHPLLCPPGVPADPLAIRAEARDIAEILADHGKGDEAIDLILAWSAADKAAADMADTDWDSGLSIPAPHAGADAPLSGAADHAGLVPYLRLALRWGGFPGWAGRDDAPQAEIGRLTEGTVPF